MKTWHVDILILRGQRAHMAISHAVSKYRRHKRDTRCYKYSLWEPKQLEIKKETCQTKLTSWSRKLKTTQNQQQNPVKKRPNTILSGIEREEGELNAGSGEQTHTPTVVTYTHAYTHTDIPMDYIRSLKAADTNEPIQERIKTRLRKRP